jgi:hypothetical protein
MNQIMALTYIGLFRTSNTEPLHTINSSLKKRKLSVKQYEDKCKEGGMYKLVNITNAAQYV